MEREAKVFDKRLTEMLSYKRDRPFSILMYWFRCGSCRPLTAPGSGGVKNSTYGPLTQEQNILNGPWLKQECDSLSYQYCGAIPSITGYDCAMLVTLSIGLQVLADHPIYYNALHHPQPFKKIIISSSTEA